MAAHSDAVFHLPVSLQCKSPGMNNGRTFAPYPGIFTVTVARLTSHPTAYLLLGSAGKAGRR